MSETHVIEPEDPTDLDDVRRALLEITEQLALLPQDAIHERAELRERQDVLRAMVARGQPETAA